VGKFIGDAVMALWGSPVAQEDDAERAVRAALDVVAAVAALAGELEIPALRARVGVTTGEAAVLVGAEREGMVTGDIVNTAARVQSVADPGAVLVGEATRRATEAAVAYDEAGRHQLKGKAEPVPLWRALRVVSGRGGALKSGRLESPFVGRDSELRLVKDLFHATAQERRTRLVSLVGIAGIGKSRLGWEFYKYIDGLAEDIWWHRGRCLPYGEGVAHWAVAEMVRMRARIAEGEEAGSARRKLEATLSEFLLDEEERAWVEPRLAHLLGLEERSAADQEDVFSAWRLFFERLAQQAPTVLLFEDLQWADSSLLDFIEHLLEWSRNHPIYVLTLARPELNERRPSWGAGRRNFVSLYLEPISDGAMDELLCGLAPGLPAELRQRIRERAEGVPLYAVETVRMLVDRRLLVQEGSVYRPVGEVETLDVPETLHALIAARLDGLAPDERRLLGVASALGKTFTNEMLAAVSGLLTDDLARLLASLVRKEVLTLQVDPRSPERGQYAFLQALVQTVAYETLARRERKRLHLAAASALERRSGAEEEDVVEVIASHYVAAYEAVADAADAPALGRQAAQWLARAGERAASLAAGGEAARYFERASELVEDAVARAELLERAGKAIRTAVSHDQSGEFFERSLALLEREGQQQAAARVAVHLAEVQWQRGDIEQALERMERSFAVLSAEEPDSNLAAVAAQLGRLHAFTGSLGRAAERLELALRLAESLRLYDVLVQALNSKFIVLAAEGRNEEATAILRHAVELTLEHDLGSESMRSYFNLAGILGDAGRFADALAQCHEGLAHARKRGYRFWAHLLSAEAMEWLFYLGDWRGAYVFEQEIPEDVRRPPSIAFFATLLPRVRIGVHQGDVAAADALLGAAAAVDAPDLQIRGVYALSAATVANAAGRFAEALEHASRALTARDAAGALIPEGAFAEAFEAALALGDEAKAEDLLAWVARLRPVERTQHLSGHHAHFAARLAARRREPDEAERGFRQAAGLFRELSTPFWLARTLYEQSRWLLSQQRAADAEPLIAEAREIFEFLEARPWLERLERVGTASVEAEALG
jgi:tetratricopeptide (TPR) repeat protein